MTREKFIVRYTSLRIWPGTGSQKGVLRIMATFKGLIYVKQGRIGTKSEGPDYFLQAHDADYHLDRKTEEHLWKPDYLLEFYSRKWVEIDGTLNGNHIAIKNINGICPDSMPKA
jgi:hypothetical protein